ncbi:Transcriptional activator spt7 [Coemansia sp. RSA 1200]|nr:Transcriptional activator spt7 [Coemansia sp. RSA 1200]
MDTTMTAKDQIERLRRVSSDIAVSRNLLERSYQVALCLDRRGEWPSYLSAAELPWLKRALESQSLWEQFISPQPEQWRFHAPPPPIFELEQPRSRGSSKQEAAGSGTNSVRAKTPLSTANHGRSDGHPTKRASQQTDRENGQGEGRAGKPEKRARINSVVSGDSDEDMLSVLSGSDIDMAVWSREGSIVLGTGSPASGADATEPKPANNAPASNDVSAAESAITCVLAAFHVRTAIFEQYLSVLYHSNECSQCTHPSTALTDLVNVELELFGDSSKNSGACCDLIESSNAIERRDADADQAALESKVEAPMPLVSRGLDEDEDYDDDDNDDNGNGNVNGTEKSASISVGPAVDLVSKHSTLPLQKPSENANADKQFPGNLDSVTAQLEHGLGISKTDSTGDTKVFLGGVFHTLDELDNVVYEHQVREMNARQIKEVMEERAAEPKDMLVNKIGSLQNMKNLAQFIDSHRDSVNMTTRELSHLLSEVRPKRTKWANERRIGQVELYDALEHVLNELKSIGEAAVPFLSQVKRKDAPDYYKVIKQPMDLGAMAKNLRNEAYNNKKQFMDHLQLIHSNCYTYNTDPGNYYRKSADTLLSKAKQLMELVPDIVIREKGSTVDDGHTEYGDESGNESTSARTNFGNREGSVVPDDGTPAPGSADMSISFAHRSSTDEISTVDCAIIANGASVGEYNSMRNQRKMSALAQNILRATEGGVFPDSPISVLTDGYERPLYEKVWRNRASQRITEYAQQAEEDAESLFPDRRIIPRMATKMREFFASTHDNIEPVDDQDLRVIERQADMSELCTVYPLVQGSSDAADIRRRNEELDRERKEWIRCVEELQHHQWKFVSECEPTAGLPCLEPLEAQMKRGGVLCWLNDDCEKAVGQTLGDTVGSNQQLDKDSRPTIEAYAAGRFPDNTMWREMADSVERLRSIRGIDNKIWAAKLNIPIGYLRSRGGANGGDSSQMVQNEEDVDVRTVRELHGDYPTRPDPKIALEVGSAGAYKLLQRTVAFMLLHLGFEAVTAPAMAAMVEFFVDYITNLGRTLRTYIDKHGRTMSTEAILAHSLYSNGIEELSELEYYMRGELGRYSNKLEDLEKKLTKSYQDTVSDGRPGTSAVDSAALEGSDAFVTGMISGLGDLGEDFFGFKELGLDKELGLEHLSVPQRLWYGRSATQDESATQVPQEQQNANSSPDAWEPITGTEGHIGLLHSFINEKLKAANSVSSPGPDEKAGGEDGSDLTVAAGEETTKDDASAQQSADVERKRHPIPEDESLPVKARFGASRPKAPPPNYLTHPRTHMHVGSGKSAAPAGGSRSSKKKPSKSTAASKTTGGSKSAKKKASAAA